MTPDTCAGGVVGDDEARRARRTFIATHHPDRGGDPELFVQGLRRMDSAASTPGRPAPPPVIVRQTLHPAQSVARFLIRLRRSLEAVHRDLTS